MDESTRQAARLWTTAMPAVSAFVSSLVRDFRDRDDVLQDTAVAIIESFGNYDASRPFIAWAMGVARNQIGLYLRRRGQDRLVFDSETVEALATAYRCVRVREKHADEPARFFGPTDVGAVLV